jgi:hypothetical protein
MRDPLTAYRHSDWSLLKRAFVEIRKHSQPPRSGFFDEAMPDSSALWLAAYVAHHRALVEKAEGYEVWVGVISHGRHPCQPRLLLHALRFQLNYTPT